MNKVELASLDMYECQALTGEPAKIYIRKGKGFIYIGQARYELTDIPKEDQQEEKFLSEKVKTHNLDFNEDFTYEGRLYFGQNDEGWLLGVMNPEIKLNPIVVIRLEERPTIN